VKRHLFWLALSIAGIALAAAPTPAEAKAAPELDVSVGFAGWANPLADYAALLLLAGERDTYEASTIYHDISPTPVRVRVGVMAAGGRIVVRTDAGIVGLPTANALFIEPGAYNPLSSKEGSPPPQVLAYAIPPGAVEYELSLPVCLYPPSPGMDHATLDVELWERGSLLAAKSVEVRFLPGQAVYSLLVEPEGRGLLPGEEVSLLESPQFTGRSAPVPFVVRSRLLSAAASDIGPDFRVLRHFQYVVVAHRDWELLDGAVKELLTDAVAMGTRLVVYAAEAPVVLGAEPFAPTPDWQPVRFGYGQATVTGADLAAVRRGIRESILERLACTYELTRNAAGADEVGWKLYRSREMSRARQFVPKFDWIGEASEGTVRGVNPVWVYDYLTRPALSEPVSSLGFRWMSAARDEARQELAEWSPRQSWKYGWFLNRNLRSAVAGGIARSMAWFTLAAVALALLSLWPRLRLWWFAAGFAAVVLVVGAWLLASLGAVNPARVKVVAVSSLRSSSLSDLAERRTLAYTYTSFAQTVELGLDNKTALLTGMAPREAEDGPVRSSQGDAWSAEVRVEALFPQETAVSTLEPAAAPIAADFAPAEDGRRVVLTGQAGGLESAFLVNGPLCIYLGDLRDGESVKLLLPVFPEEVGGFSEYNVRLVDAAIQNYVGWNIEKAYSGKEQGVEAATRIMLLRAMRHVMRNLVADGKGVTVVGVRAGDLALLLSGRRCTVPHYEIVVHRLK